MHNLHLLQSISSILPLHEQYEKLLSLKLPLLMTTLFAFIVMYFTFNLCYKLYHMLFFKLFVLF